MLNLVNGLCHFSRRRSDISWSDKHECLLLLLWSNSVMLLLLLATASGGARCNTYSALTTDMSSLPCNVILYVHGLFCMYHLHHQFGLNGNQCRSTIPIAELHDNNSPQMLLHRLHAVWCSWSALLFASRKLSCIIDNHGMPMIKELNLAERWPV